MLEGSTIGVVLLCVLVIAGALGIPISAVILLAAVALYNKIAGGASSPSSVPEPAFRKAMWITFEIWVFQMVAGLFYFGIFTRDGAAAPGARGVVFQLIFSAVSLLITVRMPSAKLPTTFGRAFLVTLCDMLVSLLVVGFLAVIAVLVFAVAM
jgi:hypothetical protein